MGPNLTDFHLEAVGVGPGIYIFNNHSEDFPADSPFERPGRGCGVTLIAHT